MLFSIFAFTSEFPTYPVLLQQIMFILLNFSIYSFLAQYLQMKSYQKVLTVFSNKAIKNLLALAQGSRVAEGPQLLH